MTDIAIHAEGLSKRYKIGVRRDSYATLRENITDAALAPVRSLGNLILRRDGGASRAEEDTVWALRDVSFDVKLGEATAIIGHNGAGKSTLLKILSRITEPTSGRAIVRGRVGSLLEVGTGFHPELTGRENIFLNGAVLGMSHVDIRRRFDEIVDFAGIETYLDTPVKRYSTGMFMRLAFAVAAHLEPDVLIVDEVLAVGDAEFQKKCLGKMGEVTGEGRTVLFVSHNMAAISDLCRNGILMERGRIAQYGPVADVIAHYLATGRVATGTVPIERHSLWVDHNELSFVSVGVRNPGGEASGHVQREEGVEVIIEYDVLAEIPPCHIGIELWNSAGVCILSSSSMDSPSLPQEALRPGRHTVCCRIPPELLRNGFYSISLQARIPNVRWLDHVEHPLKFEVIDLSSPVAKLNDGARLGLMFPLLDWTLEDGTSGKQIHVA